MSVLPQSRLSVWYTETTGSVLSSFSTKMPVAGNDVMLVLSDKKCHFNIDMSKYFNGSVDVCVCRLSALSLAVEQTRVCRKLLSAQGRGRYLLRLALSRKALPQFITHLLHTPRVLEVSYDVDSDAVFTM